jgi:outer membrane lipoprotein-sorting protein
MRWITVAALALLAAPAYGQESDAEKLYRAMEKKVRAAKAIHFVFDGQVSGMGMKSTLKGEVRMAQGEKANLALDGQFAGQSMKMTIISDGKKAYTKYNETASTKDNDPSEKHFDQALNMVSRMGMVAAFMSMQPPGKDTDFDKTFPIKEFKLGAKEKIGKQDTQVVEYQVMPSGQPAAKVTLWLDTQTQLPVKREIVSQDPKGNELRISETFTTFELDPKIDAKVFELPK